MDMRDFTLWSGGEMPCDAETKVMVQLYNRTFLAGKAWCYVWRRGTTHSVRAYKILMPTSSRDIALGKDMLKSMITPSPKRSGGNGDAQRYSGLCTALMADKETQSKFLKRLEVAIDATNPTRQSIDAAFDAAIAAMEKA